ncbi:MAG TPA: Bax inhibitor-1/YccA family protein [Thermoanaerobaculia bacterium]
MGQYPYRSEQPGWIDGRTADTAIRERDFFRSVYTWMFTGLMLTAAASLLVVNSPAMQRAIFENRLVFWGLIIAELGMVFYLSARIQKITASTAAMLFLGYSAFNGLTLSAIFLVYTSASISLAFFTAAGMFAGMSIFGYVTKRSLAGWGSFLMMGVIGIVIAMVVNIFLRSNAMDFMISIIGVFIFLGLTAYDTQKLKSYAHAEGGMRSNLAIIGALALYLDFINLFLFLLRIFGGNRR